MVSLFLPSTLLRAIAILAAVALLCPAQDPIFRSDVSLVRVDAQVTSGNDTVEGLGKQDFILLDNGRPQAILYSSQEEQALDLMLLLDISSSMQPVMRRVAASAHAALGELRPGDRVAVGDFNTASWLMAGFNGNLPDVEQTLDRVVDLRFGGGTHILRAVYDAAGYFLRPENRGSDNGTAARRRAILLITDDFGHFSMKEKTVVERMWAADIVLCGLIVRPPDEPIALRPPGSEDMVGVVEKTGGEIVNTTATGTQTGEAFRQMMRRIRRRYSLYYQMPAGRPGATRRVTLSLSPDARARYPKADVLSRKGYVIPKK
jgi:VWFA-related protein